VLFALSVVLGLVGTALADRSASPEQAVTRTVVVFGITALALFVFWLASRSWQVTIDGVSFGTLGVMLVLLVAAWFVNELRGVLFRADTLIWAESPFVNDIIKFRSGGALYGARADLSSFNYTPGAPLATWALASLVGLGDSIPAYRVVQLVFVALSAAIGVRAVSLLRRLHGDSRPSQPWTLIWFPLLFLAGTNSIANPFNHLLHNDALALLVCAAGFLVAVEYVVQPRRWLLLVMVIIPVLGFLVKQSLGIWCVMFGAWLLVFDRPFRFWRAVMVGGSALALIVLLYAGGVALWGDDFRYWVIEGLGTHAVSPLRSVQHALQGWAFWAAGLWAGWLLLRGQKAVQLLGLWLLWAFLFAVETYTSGIAWMLNHMGPGSFLAIVWLGAALPTVWPAPGGEPTGASWQWLRAAMFTLASVFLLSGLGLVRVPYPNLPADANRYASDIEREFDGLPVESVLLDHGSWVYLPAGVVQKDRMAPAGEAGWTGTADFTGLFERIRSHHYRRILVRDLHEADFMYDYSEWAAPSGVRDSLLHYYREARVIPAARTVRDRPWLSPITVLEPRLASDSGSASR
jgi:hypothetical protein